MTQSEGLISSLTLRRSIGPLGPFNAHYPTPISYLLMYIPRLTLDLFPKWVRDQQFTSREAQRDRILFFAHRDFICNKYQEIPYKIVTRWYRTPLILAKTLSTAQCHLPLWNTYRHTCFSDCFMLKSGGNMHGSCNRCDLRSKHCLTTYQTVI